MYCKLENNVRVDFDCFFSIIYYCEYVNNATDFQQN